MRTIKPTEDQIQKTVIRWVRLQKFGDYVFHIPNEGPRTPRYGAKMKAMGLMRGVSDVFIALPCGDYNGMFIELKREGGKCTPAQSDFLDRMSAVGYKTAVTYGVEDTITAISDYINLGHASLD